MRKATHFALMPIEDPKAFEKLMVECATVKYGKCFSLIGRNGQTQYGLDLISKDGVIGIQCKNYQETRESRNAFVKVIGQNYETACRHYPKLKQFVAATTLKRDSSIQQSLMDYSQHSEPGKPEFDVLYWEDITELILEHDEILTKYFPEVIVEKKPDVHTDNQLYCNAFTETLFLHRNRPNGEKVCLKNLFILQNYCLEGPHVYHQTRRYLKQFISGEKKTLVIEGNAGSGKSSLVSWMAYEHKNSKNHRSVFGERNLIVIRLRELDKETLQNHGLLEALLDYMRISDMNQLLSLFPDSALVLDGFDELCMLAGDVTSAWSIERLVNSVPDNWKIIITSRPYYVDRLREVQPLVMTLQHFDKKQRIQWLLRYIGEQYCHQPINPEIAEYIAQIDDWTTAAVCDTPMTLYMLVSREGLTAQMLTNCWQLYHQIFRVDISSAEYNRMYPNQLHDYMHPDAVVADILYSITEEIAYQMYRQQNETFYLSREEVDDIIEKINQREHLHLSESRKGILQKCYALNCFWKERTNDGAVEFYHNNIRDFFLCEKLLREINREYNRLRMRKVTRKEAVEHLIKLFENLFQYDTINSIVNTFILYREFHAAKKGAINEFACIEKQYRILPELFEKMIGTAPEGDQQARIYILSSVCDVYSYAYHSFLKGEERIQWWKDVRTANDSEIIQSSFQSLYLNTPVMDLQNCPICPAGKGNFDGINLSGKDLRNVGFYGASFRHAMLQNTTFEGASLEGADLTGAHLNGADLHYSSLEHANLEDADLTGAILHGTDLPDGFVSDDEKEQVKHLRALQIKGLTI